jgi:hypothetical protein
MDRAVGGSGVGDSGDELEELGRSDDRVWGRAGFDQVFLGDFGSHVPGIGQSIGADDGQDDVVTDARLLFCGEDMAGSVTEEGQDVFVRPRRRIGQIHDDVGTIDCFGDSCAGGDVDPVCPTECLHVVPGVSELGGDLASDQSASENDDLHDFLLYSDKSCPSILGHNLSKSRVV